MQIFAAQLYEALMLRPSKVIRPNCSLGEPLSQTELPGFPQNTETALVFKRGFFRNQIVQDAACTISEWYPEKDDVLMWHHLQQAENITWLFEQSTLLVFYFFY